MEVDEPQNDSVDTNKGLNADDRDSNTPHSNNDSITSEQELVLSKNETKVTLKASFEISENMDIGEHDSLNSEPKNSLVDIDIDPNNIDVYLFDDSEDE